MKKLSVFKKFIEKYKDTLSIDDMGSFCALYYEIFRKINYDDPNIKSVYVRIISNRTVSIYFYVTASFEQLQAKIILDDIKFQMDKINFDYIIISMFSNQLEIENEQVIKLK